MTASTQPASQTLSRGIRILEVLADSATAMTVDEIATHLGVHRSVAYRLIRTLEDHGLVVRSNNAVSLGARLAALASGVQPDVQAAALPEMTEIAGELGVTCFLSVFDHDECVNVSTVEPRGSITTVTQRPGTRHPVTMGAPGKIVLGMLTDTDRFGLTPALADEVARSRERGYATSHDEVTPFLRAVAVPLPLRGQPPSALAAVYVDTQQHDDAAIATRLAQSATSIRTALGG